MDHQLTDSNEVMFCGWLERYMGDVHDLFWFENL